MVKNLLNCSCSFYGMYGREYHSVRFHFNVVYCFELHHKSFFVTNQMEVLVCHNNYGKSNKETKVLAFLAEIKIT